MDCAYLVIRWVGGVYVIEGFVPTRYISASATPTNPQIPINDLRRFDAEEPIPITIHFRYKRIADLIPTERLRLRIT
ncbi:hypothetical protein [Vulcanisaeta distributa]|uniref:Uncharacterized protein n=1 Tax=Vulcanisaeta distributa (strain DSM 14429 / JCM 11212 / NBRC 100878 / IC-017) TaxID=572478 RepID=E1QSE1_VULDI|nr:hypothetical protein [Vulcanisaeta distributa]ADN49534.1 hypothetical protein Vdis_0121 [Vulcanisaeta distributa DSM 14429]